MSDLRPAVIARPKVWIILVNWNGWRDTLECLESVFRQDYRDFGVMLCDNASSDGSVDAIARWAAGDDPYQPPEGPLARLTSPALAKPLSFAVVNDPQAVTSEVLRHQLLLVHTGGNLGFAGGNNVGIRLALQDPACQLVWLLNNDTVVEPECLTRMVAKATSAADIGVTGSVNCFYAEPERVQALGGGYFFKRVAKAGLHGHGVPFASINSAMAQKIEPRIDWVSGASMLVAREFIERVGEMEERYFLYYEEIDWALRGTPPFRNALAFDARLYHKAGSSTGEHGDNAFSLYTQYRSRFKLYRKLLPALLPVCYLRVLRDLLVAYIRGRNVATAALWRASRDDLFGR